MFVYLFIYLRISFHLIPRALSLSLLRSHSTQRTLHSAECNAKYSIFLFIAGVGDQLIMWSYMRWWRWRCFNFSITCLGHTWIVCVCRYAGHFTGNVERKKKEKKCNAMLIAVIQNSCFRLLERQRAVSLLILSTLFLLDIFCHSWSTSFALAAMAMQFAWSEWRSVPTTHTISSTFRSRREFHSPSSI